MMIPGLKEVIQAINRLSEAVEKATAAFEQSSKNKDKPTGSSQVKPPCAHRVLAPMANPAEKVCLSCGTIYHQPVITVATSVVQVDPEKQPANQSSQTATISTRCLLEGHDWPTPAKLGANCTRCGERMMSGRPQPVQAYPYHNDVERCFKCGSTEHSYCARG